MPGCTAASMISYGVDSRKWDWDCFASLSYLRLDAWARHVVRRLAARENWHD
jgi:hypothetical protein